jgi:uroporphyrinogen decarboxylase
MNKLIVEKLKNQNFYNRQIPIWLMRQAGRYLPEYREIRNRVSGFWDLCYNPKIASEVTLQPVKRFDLDAAIIFADILVVPHSMKINIEFLHNEGPVVEKLSTINDLTKLVLNDDNDKFRNIYETIKITKQNLSHSKTIIGFAGAPWTVATYIMEGKGKTNFEISKNHLKNNHQFVKSLIDLLTEQTIFYIKGQIKAGADVIQIFDSWAGVLDGSEYFEEIIIDPTTKIVNEIRKEYKDFPFIVFPKDISNIYNYLEKTKANCINLSNNFTKKDILNLSHKYAIQGNLDPQKLLSYDKQSLKAEILKILEEFYDFNYIFNLSHGILQNTPLDNVYTLIEEVRNYAK